MTANDQSTELLISYLRAELDWYLRRIDRADARAAGTITVGIAFVGVVATALLALHHPPWQALAAMGVGGLILTLGLAFTVSAMDTSQEPAKWFTTVFNRWPFASFYEKVRELVGDRHATEAELCMKLEPRRPYELVKSLRTRLAAAQRVAISQENSVRVAALVTFIGMLVIAVSGAVAVSVG